MNTPIVMATRWITVLSFFWVSICLHAQFRDSLDLDLSSSCYDPIISEIGNLESNKDPKCHATANRLEDFMYGTPLTFEARAYRTEIQKDLAYNIWSQASKLSEGSKTVNINQINQAANLFLKLVVSNESNYLVTTEDNYIELNRRDLGQYTSIAYGLRAILAVQQRALFGDSNLGLLDKEAVNQLKLIVDMATLAILKIADNEARDNNEYVLTMDHLKAARSLIIQEALVDQNLTLGQDSITQDHGYEMLKKTIRQKLLSYEKYNNLAQKVFLRNIQVYFAKARWPDDAQEEKNVVSTFQNGSIQYATELLYFAEKLAKADNKSYISINEMNRAITSFLPFEVNEWEDVTYFPLLPQKDQITIESYDLDAFRDSGLHWKILEYVLDEPKFKGILEPDPFATELMAEAIAHFGVLLWRMAGIETANADADRLSQEMLLKGMESIRRLTKSNNGRYGAEETRTSSIVSANDNEKVSNEDDYFEDVTTLTGIDFVHRSSDWLNRKLRSYVIDRKKKVAKLAIPPAFGGSGVAAEDINNDGYDDILLLSGSGNKLYLNNGDKTFTDITETSGIINIKEDGSYAEPRQPIIADFNNDGYQDIFISYVYDDHQMFMGDGTGKFVNKTGSSRFGGRGLVGGPCTALDYDNDGLLDLYIGYFGNYMAGELPTLARSNTNGSPNQLFKNLDGFDFKNVTLGSGVDNRGWTQAVGHTDINNDGWQDIIAGNDFGKNAYYINRGDGRFVDRGTKYETDKASYTMNIGITDLNRDMYPDFYISNIVVMEKDDKYVLPDEETKMHFDPHSLSTMRVKEANDLFISNVKKNDDVDEVVYGKSQDIARGYGDTGWSWDADFFDADNDGDDDLYVLNGMNPYSVYGTENQYYQNTDGESSANVVFAESHSEHNVFFENEGGKFVQQSEKSGLDLYHTSRSAVYTDYDNDGDLDILVSNYHGQAFFYENKRERTGNNWLKIRLTDKLFRHQKDAIGARIIVDAGDNKGMWREVHSTDGYLSGHPKTMHFGIGVATKATILVIWSDGKKDSFEIRKINRTYKITRTKRNVVIDG